MATVMFRCNAHQIARFVSPALREVLHRVHFHFLCTRQMQWESIPCAMCQFNEQDSGRLGKACANSACNHESCATQSITTKTRGRRGLLITAARRKPASVWWTFNMLSASFANVAALLTKGRPTFIWFEINCSSILCSYDFFYATIE